MGEDEKARDDEKERQESLQRMPFVPENTLEVSDEGKSEVSDL